MSEKVFNHEIGHPEIQERILKSIKSEHFPHAFLFHGREGSGKEAFAIEVAKLINCEKGPLYLCKECSQCKKIANLQHADVKFIFPVPSQTKVKPEEIGDALSEKAKNPYRRIRFPGKNVFISIETVRELKQEAKFKLYEGEKKVFILSEADLMRPEAANALLKILEEPPPNLLLILTTSHLFRIFPTIRSRCQLIHFPPLEGDFVLKTIRKYTVDQPDHLALIIQLSQENIKLAFDFIDDTILDKREQAIEFLRKIVVSEKSNELIAEIDKITRGKDKREMSLILFFLLTWIRDALHYKINQGKGNLYLNSDKLDSINGFVTGYPLTDYPAVIRQTQKAQRELEDPRNLNPTLIFTNLSIKLNNLIRKN